MPNFSGTWSTAQQFEARSQGIWPKTPDAPTIGTATAGNNLCTTVTFTAPANTGYPSTITSYTAKTTPGCITATGTSSPITITGLVCSTSYTVSVRATNDSGAGYYSGASNSITARVATCATYTTPGTYTWIAPAGVTSVSVVAVGGGGGAVNQTLSSAAGNGGGGGGELRYKNNIAVTPGNSYSVIVGAGGAGGASDNSVSSTAGGYSQFVNSSTLKAFGGLAAPNNSSYGSGGSGGVGDGGGIGGRGGSGDGSCRPGGGGGAGGYSGAGGNGGNGARTGTSQGGTSGAGGGGGGGNGGNSCYLVSGRGGGTALGGQGTDGAGSPYNSSFFYSGGIGSSKTGFTCGYGGGAGTIRSNPPYTAYYAGLGGGGAVRIVWCKNGLRGIPTFPSTNVGV